MLTPRPSERIWSLVSGFPGEKRRKRLLGMFQAYIDDSGRGQEIFVLAGYIAPADAWAAFSDRWQALLDGEGGYQRMAEFKMKKIADTANNRRRCALFYALIEEHAQVAISYTVDVPLFKRIVREYFEEPLASAIDNPWDAAIGGLMWLLSRNQKALGVHTPVDFIFDEATEKARCIQGYDILKQLNLMGTHLMGDTPIAGGNRLPNALKFALEKGRQGLPRNFDPADLDYLRGLADAGVEGAEEVMELIHKHGTIALYLDY